jgi:hypothetical protein
MTPTTKPTPRSREPRSREARLAALIRLGKTGGKAGRKTKAA